MVLFLPVGLWRSTFDFGHELIMLGIVSPLAHAFQVLQVEILVLLHVHCVRVPDFGVEVLLPVQFGS